MTVNGPRKAVFSAEGHENIEVHFNPASLQLTLSTKLNEKKAKGEGGRQAVNESTAKLSVELVFDTTDTLNNVCDTTVKVARLLGDKGQPPPLVTFAWGAFKFVGIVDSYKETLDFFSAEGVPLRSSVALGMTQDENIFDRGPAGQQAAGWSPAGGAGSNNARVAPTGGSITQTAARAGAPEAGRFIAAMNGVENMRFPSAPTLTVDVSASLSPPAAFAGVGAGAPSPRGAFSGLRVPQVSAAAAARLDPARLLRRVETHTHATEDGASFELGGRMLSPGSRLGGTARARVRIEED